MRASTLPLLVALSSACAGSPSDSGAGDASGEGTHGDGSSGGGSGNQPADDTGVDPSQDDSGGSDDGEGTTTDGGEPPMVTPCPTDGAVVGQWENVEPAGFHEPSNMQTVAVAVDPIQGVVYAAASNKTNGGDGSTGIHRSDDCGATWTLQSTGEHGADLNTGQLWAMMVDPSTPSTIYVANGYGSGPTLYKSSNAGVDWRPLEPAPEGTLTYGNFVQAVAMDPQDSEHIAVTFHDNCNAPNHSLCLSQSTDAGDSWSLFDGPAELGGWQEAATLSVFGPQHYFYGSGEGGFYTADGGATWHEVIESGMFARYAGSIAIGGDGSAYAAVSGAGVFVSHADPTADPPILLGSSWQLLEGSPQSTNIVSYGAGLIAGTINGPPFVQAELADPSVWAVMPTQVTQGSNQMAYDPAHHVVYSANFEGGLLRLFPGE